jgi:hypothetical protein
MADSIGKPFLQLSIPTTPSTSLRPMNSNLIGGYAISGHESMSLSWSGLSLEF